MKEKIIQFGEGNFLRGFVDYFTEILNQKGLFDGSIVVVKPTNRGNVDKFIEQDCKYNLYLRGIENGKIVNDRTEINSISRIINPYEEYDAYMALAENPDIKFVVSNTTEAGIVFDASCRLDDKPAVSFPAKLTQLLYKRFKLGLDGFIMLPCELIDKNGDALKDCVLRYVDLWGLEQDFAEYIENSNSFSNTLVDRIVTGFPNDEAGTLWEEIGYEDKLLDTAEIYHLWVIEGDYENLLPLKTAGFNVVWTDDASPYKKRKVRVLNGVHTSMVCAALLAGVDTVGECMQDKEVSAFMYNCLHNEILKVIGDNDDNRAFVNAVEERFKNPYIKHQLRAIVLNSVSKFAVRVLPSILDYVQMYSEIPKSLAFSLASLIYFYKNDTPNDDKNVEAFMKESSISEILSSQKLWGEDIGFLSDYVRKCYDDIENLGIREAMKCTL